MVTVNGIRRWNKERRADPIVEGQAAARNTEPAVSTSLVKERNEAKTASPTKAVAPPYKHFPATHRAARCIRQ